MDTAKPVLETTISESQANKIAKAWRRRPVGKLLSGASMLMLPLGIFWNAWFVWAVILWWLGRRHPAIYDSAELGEARIKLGWLALVIFILCFTYQPFADGGL